jgi:AAA+ ATPase superfamily predicted ATPase
MIVNPFTYGDPISSPNRFFGRQRSVEQVFSRLLNAQFESSSLVGERRIGKTSLLKYLAHPAVRHFYGISPDKYLFIYLDLQSVEQNWTPQRLWKWLLEKMVQKCQNPEVRRVLEAASKESSIDTLALMDIFDNVDENDQYVVFLLDEFERVTENQNFSPDFFYGLRSLAIHHHLSLITSSHHELIELTHSEKVRASPFFNIFANINIQLFTRAEAQDLITRSLVESGLSFTEGEIEIIFRIAGYHPYFLQVACYFLFNAYSEKLNPSERITFLEKEFRKQAEIQLSDYWRTSVEQEKIVLTAMALLEQQQRKVGGHTFSMGQLQDLYTRSPQTLVRLEKRGLLTSESGAYSLLNSTFGKWIRDEITNTVSDQQSYDDWLISNKSVVERLSAKARNELGDILPQIAGNYRNLIITWISDPKNLIMVAGLLKTALGFV